VHFAEWLPFFLAIILLPKFRVNFVKGFQAAGSRFEVFLYIYSLFNYLLEEFYIVNYVYIPLDTENIYIYIFKANMEKLGFQRIIAF
jgi:hypothetical protein